MNLSKLEEHLALNYPRLKIVGLVVLALILALGVVTVARADTISGKGKVAAPTAETTFTSTAARWSGPWAAVQLGYAVEANDISTGFGDLSLATHDVTFGGAVGWDHQFAGTNLLIGVGADANWSRAESVVASFDRQWSAWARGGVLLTPNMLAYGLVGYTSVHGDLIAPQLASWEGLTLGGGLEVLFKDGWFAGLEGRRVDLGGDMGAESNQYSATLRLGWKFGALK